MTSAQTLVVVSRDLPRFRSQSNQSDALLQNLKRLEQGCLKWQESGSGKITEVRYPLSFYDINFSMSHFLHLLFYSPSSGGVVPNLIGCMSFICLLMKGRTTVEHKRQKMQYLRLRIWCQRPGSLFEESVGGWNLNSLLQLVILCVRKVLPS